jgi:hypothetical protein
MELAAMFGIVALCSFMIGVGAGYLLVKKENERLREGIIMCLDLLDHGDFRNGITGPSGLIDEGEVHAGRMVKRLTALLEGGSRVMVND